MRLAIAASAIAFLSLAQAQAPSTRDLNLKGDRFKPLTYDQMTPEQKKMIDDLLAGERTGTGGPFNVLLRSPEMGNLGQKMGAEMRFHAALPPNVRETVIILTARWWMAQYEWNAHKRAALQNGVSPAIVDAIATGKRPTGLDPQMEAAYNFVTELYKMRQVSDATFAAAKEKFGEKGVVDIIGLTGWYNLVSEALDVDRYPLPDGAKPELKPLANPFP